MLLDGIGEDAKHDIGEARMSVLFGLHPTLLYLFLRCIGQGLALLPVLEIFPKRHHVGAKGKGIGGQYHLQRCEADGKMSPSGQNPAIE